VFKQLHGQKQQYHHPPSHIISSFGTLIPQLLLGNTSFAEYIPFSAVVKHISLYTTVAPLWSITI